jgi:hypothetical protein
MLFSSLWVWKVETKAGCHSKFDIAHCCRVLNFGRQAMAHFRHLALIFLFLSPAVAADEVPLEGEALLRDEDCAGGVKSDTCILSFQLRGKAAKLLFKRLRDEPQKEECTGSMEKSGGNGLYCHAYEDGTYLCEFGYSFKEDAFTFSAEDC